MLILSQFLLMNQLPQTYFLWGQKSPENNFFSNFYPFEIPDSL